tara:strand:+ start:1500 stop:3557 length:2058 start_codon:yes stop_codon:yes gene_type:complete
MAEEKLTLKTFLESSQFIKGAKKVKTALKGIGKAASTLGLTMSTAMAVRGIKAMTDMAGEAEKTDLRFKRVFSSMQSDSSMFAKTLSDDLGRVKTDIQSGMVSFQAFFQGLGFGGKEAANYSQEMQALSLDLASFFQLQDSNAQRRFLAALAGSPEVLDQFGINLKEAALQEELFNMGLDTSVQKTNEMTKTTARLSIIMRAMTDNGIVGDAKRTINTYATTVTRTEASLKDLAISIGDKFIPIAKIMLNIVIDLADEMERFFNSSEKEIKLNKEQKKEFNAIAQSLLQYARGTEQHKIQLERLLQLYPNFLRTLKGTDFTMKDLEKRVQDLNDAFDLHEKIEKNNDELFITKKRVKELTESIGILSSNYELNVDAAGDDKVAVKALTKSYLQLTNGIGENIGMLAELDNSKKREADLTIEQTRLNNELGESYRTIKGEEAKGVQKVQERELLPTMNVARKTRDDIEKPLDVSDMLIPLPPPIQWDSYFNLEGFELIRTRLGEQGKLITETFFTFQAGMGVIANQLTQGLSQAFGSAVSDVLSGGRDFGTAIRLATKQALGAMAADLAAKALYYGILATGFGAAGLATLGMTIPQGVSAGKAAGVFAAGAAILGGASAVISGAGGGMSTSSTNTGGGANGGTGVGGGSFDDFMNTIQGEQTFRINGADLVAAVGRQNNFTNAIGG